MIELKFDVIARLKEKGINTTKIRKENYFGQRTLQELKAGKITGLKTLETLCALLEMQPGSIIRYIPGKTDDSPAAGPTEKE